MTKIVLERVSKGIISAGTAAELLHKTVYEVQEAAKKKGVLLGITGEQYMNRKRFAKKL